jgi:hypothetical protein
LAVPEPALLPVLSRVTTPVVVTIWPARGEAAPLPWMSWMGVMTMSSLTMVPWPCASVTFAPTTLATLTKKVSFGSLVVSPLTLTVNW